MTRDDRPANSLGKIVGRTPPTNTALPLASRIAIPFEWALAELPQAHSVGHDEGRRLSRAPGFIRGQSELPDRGGELMNVTCPNR